jgi:hypothetical protein
MRHISHSSLKIKSAVNIEPVIAGSMLTADGPG